MRRGSLIALAAVFVVLVPAAIGASSTTASNEHAAHAAAKRMLAELQLPPGATPARHDLSKRSALLAPPVYPITPALVDEHRFWGVPGSPASTLGWVRAHPPAGARLNESGSVGRLRLLQATWAGFEFPARKGVLLSRELTVTVAPAANGGTALRADAEVVWFVDRPASDRVPTGIGTITITERPLGEPPSATITVTSASTVRKIVTYINQLPPAQPGVVACPDDRGPYFKLDFLKASSTTPSAIATADESGCGLVTLSVDGQQEPALMGGPQLVKWLAVLLRSSFP